MDFLLHCTGVGIFLICAFVGFGIADQLRDGKSFKQILTGKKYNNAEKDI
jgi:hypothetical protein